jgi:Rrf2 family protein
MKVSKKAYYGLRAAVNLASAQKAVSAHDLALSEHIPEDFLEKILQKLRRAGIVESKKGVDGGYALARPAETVSAWDILSTLDGPIKPFSPPVKNTLPCAIISHCQTNEVWRTLEREIEATLSKITLSNLAKPQN